MQTHTKRYNHKVFGRRILQASDSQIVMEFTINRYKTRYIAGRVVQYKGRRAVAGAYKTGTNYTVIPVHNEKS